MVQHYNTVFYILCFALFFFCVRRRRENDKKPSCVRYHLRYQLLWVSCASLAKRIDSSPCFDTNLASPQISPRDNLDGNWYRGLTPLSRKNISFLCLNRVFVFHPSVFAVYAVGTCQNMSKLTTSMKFPIVINQTSHSYTKKN